MINPYIHLSTERVLIEPVDTKHLADLRTYCDDPDLWEHTFHSSPFGTEKTTAGWLRDAKNEPDGLTLAIVDRMTGKAIGSTRYFDIQPQHRKLEIGRTFIAKPYWRSHVNTECKFLMLRHAFESAGAVRVQFRIEARNERSAKAVLRLGATHEGTLRNFRIKPTDGSIRNLAFYSIIASEWPAVKERLAALLEKNALEA